MKYKSFIQVVLAVCTIIIMTTAVAKADRVNAEGGCIVVQNSELLVGNIDHHLCYYPRGAEIVSTANYREITGQYTREEVTSDYHTGYIGYINAVSYLESSYQTYTKRKRGLMCSVDQNDTEW